MKPWEKYQASEPKGPWEKYANGDASSSPVDGESSGTPWSSVPKNAAKDVWDLAKNTAMMTVAAPMATNEILKNPKEAWDTIKNAPGEIWGTVKNYLTRPVESFKEHPVNMAMDVAGAVGGVADLARAAAPVAEDVAQNLGRRSLGYTKRFLKTPDAIERANNVAQEMLDAGVITPLAGPGEMVDRVGGVIEKTGSNIGDFLKSQGGGFDTQKAIDAINELRPKGSNGQWLRGGAYDKINSILDDAMETVQAHKEQIPFEEANRLKGLLQDIVNWNGTNLDSGTGQRVAGAMRGAVDSSLNEAAENSMTQPAFNQFLSDKKRYGAAMEAQDALANRLSSEKGNRAIGLTDFILGAGEVGAGNPVGGAAAIVGKKAVERYGMQTGAWTADKIAKILSTIPQAFGQYAPALARAAAAGGDELATHLFVLQQQDPEFNNRLRKLSDPKEDQQ